MAKQRRSMGEALKVNKADAEAFLRGDASKPSSRNADMTAKQQAAKQASRKASKDEAPAKELEKLTVRVPVDIMDRVRETAPRRRKEAGKDAALMQTIVSEALETWLRKHEG